MNPKQILKVAEEIAIFLADEGTPALVIGALALAAHGYVRMTQDLDLGTNADAQTLKKLEATLRRRGYEADFQPPDGADPLSGVLNVTGAFGLVQVVSFGSTFPRVIRDALEGAHRAVTPGSVLRVTPLEQLIALKLYARGSKSRADVEELLLRNPELDLAALREVCGRYRLNRELDSVLEAAGVS